MFNNNVLFLYRNSGPTSKSQSLTLCSSTMFNNNVLFSHRNSGPTSKSQSLRLCSSTMFNNSAKIDPLGLATVSNSPTNRLHICRRCNPKACSDPFSAWRSKSILPRAPLPQRDAPSRGFQLAYARSCGALPNPLDLAAGHLATTV